MKFLFDTHAILWAGENSPLLSERAKKAFLSQTAEKYVSIASAWEVAIKLGTQKLSLEGGLSEFFRMIDDNGLIMLGVAREYLDRLHELPLWHKDPFDRLIISTANTENLTLVTVDENIQKYDVSWLW